MARGPFQGTFAPNSKPTIITAPDAMVFINGETDIIGCQSCKRKFDLGKYITQISVSLGVDTVPGNASITMTIPTHVVDDFYFDGNPVITPMMEVEIYSKGYYLLEGIPQYYPIFWGLVTEVGAGYSSGEHTVTIQCADILKWWEICMMNISPAFTAANPQLGRSIYGNTLYGTNVYDLIYTLSNMAFGDIIVATGSLNSLNKEETQKSTFNAALGDIMLYWSSRFSKIRSSLLLYGVNGIAVRGDSIAHGYDSGKFKKGVQTIASCVRAANGGDKAAQLVFDPTDPGVTAFRTQFSSAGEVEFWQSDFQSKLEIANACKTAVGFEFYMDVTGDIVFKPPFFNLDILANKPISWIQPIDIIDYDITDSESGVITQLIVQGNFGGNTDYGLGPETTPFTSVTDYHLLRKYGWRSRPYNSEFMGDTTRMFYHGLDILDRINSDRVQMSVTIPHRPELRLGFPVYVSHLDQIWYVKGINHNISFGSRATTSLSLTAKRGKFIAPKGISSLKRGGTHDISSVKAGTKNASKKTVPATSTGKATEPLTVRKLAQTSFNLDLGEAATIPPIKFDPNDPRTLDPYQPLILRHPKTGNIVGYPNVVMVYTRPYDPKAAFSNIAGEKDKNPMVPKNNQNMVAQRQAVNKTIALAEHDPDTALNLSNKYDHNRFSYGLNSAGVYVYAQDVDKVITQFALLPYNNISVTQGGAPGKFLDTSIKLKNPNTMVRPVSDERGFEVIGHFRYGRGVSLRDGSLILNEGAHNTGVNVGTQLALGGDLFSTLTAQSQGLTSITTSYSNPADTVARLIPEDLQTAASLVPGANGAKTPAFSDVGTSFVDTAPLSSPEARGFPTSVEASQLSRALTLAEMTVKSNDYAGNKQCQCQTGRASLTFISVGYQVSPVTPATSTSGETLYGTNTVSNTVTGEDGNPIGGFQDSSNNLSLNNQTNPIPSWLKQQNLIDRVETYLFNLYKTLDEPHQRLENQLRGDPSGLEPDIRKQPSLFMDSPQDQTFGNFTPPFSSPNRAALGDPLATAQQAESSKKDLAQTFSNFSSDLKKNTQKAQLSQEISNLSSQLVSLNSRLSSSQIPGVVQVLGADSATKLQQQINSVTQDLHNKQTQLALLG
jgi:hypothetical protein